MGKNYLISYPRSGNTWLRYCVEFVTSRPTFGYLCKESSSFDRKSVGKFCGLKTNLKAPPILIKRHSFEQEFDESLDRLVLLVRDYNEAITRHIHKVDFNAFKSQVDDQTNEVDYLAIIRQFEEWNGKKLLIYYEDLITNLKVSLESVLSFLMVEDYGEKVSDLIENIEFHKEKSIMVYNRHAASETGGNHLKFHSNKVSINELLQREKFLKQKNLDLYNKFLKRYELASSCGIEVS